MLTFAEPFDALLIPLGNGALFNGVARVMKGRSPKTRMVAVQAAGAPATVESWRAGRIVVRDRIDTIADGIGVRVPIPQALDDMRGLVDDAVLVTEDAIVQGCGCFTVTLGLWRSRLERLVSRRFSNSRRGSGGSLSARSFAAAI